MAAWRLARSLMRLRNEINLEWPMRDRASDGSIGDADHAGRKSDHNPNDAGVVRAIDTDDDIDAEDDTVPFKLAEHLRHLGKSGFRPLQNGGLVIYFARYCSAATTWDWRPYTGINAHKSHVHVSVGRDPFQYDCEYAWSINEITQPEEPPMTEQKLDAIHAAILTDIAEGREDDARENLTYRNSHELWAVLISGAVDLPANENGTPAYASRVDMTEDLLNTPSMVRDLTIDVAELQSIMGGLARAFLTLDERLQPLMERLEQEGLAK